jgi:5-oxoprolinase (ATP-hydrolysing) subunit A
VADAIAEAVAGVDTELWLYGLSGGEGVKAGQARGLRVASEVFADRTYQDDGTLTPRTRPDAMITDAGTAVAQASRLVKEGVVRSVNGRDVRVAADTICVHGDGEHAVAFARELRAALTADGVDIRSLVRPLVA